MKLIKKILKGEVEVEWFNHYHFFFLSVLTAIVLFGISVWVGGLIYQLLKAFAKWALLN